MHKNQQKLLGNVIIVLLQAHYYKLSSINKGKIERLSIVLLSQDPKYHPFWE